jgi:hypothetical protein
MMFLAGSGSTGSAGMTRSILELHLLERPIADSNQRWA